jgi:repressor LexA
MMQSPTPRQMEILRFIRDYRHSHGYSPTFQEIGESLGLTKVTVFEHAAALARKGLLRRGSKHKARSLEIEPAFRFPEAVAQHIPLAGRIAAGRPLEAVEDVEELDLTGLFGERKDLFALRVQGSSMMDEGIRDGDYVLCRKGAQPHNGQTVVATLPDGEATLKKMYREGGQIRLQPANPAFQPLFVRDVDIQGVVVGVVRKV